jgi:ubiquinone/menaquinone biosynthesis C-methylase UbiE
MVDVAKLYRHRFSADEQAAKDRIWRVLVEHFFQRYVPPDATVLDLACGYGEFIRFVRAKRKLAVDINADSASRLHDPIEFHLGPATRLDFLADGSIDFCFTSNFFEHLPSKSAINDVLGEVYRVLRPGGRFMALQPNIRYAYAEYWDFYDHHTPLSHLSAAEAFALAGFEVVELIDRFLPFSTKSALPKHPALVRAYLACPWAWRILGKQFLIVGAKPGNAT